MTIEYLMVQFKDGTWTPPTLRAIQEELVSAVYFYFYNILTFKSYVVPLFFFLIYF